MMRFHWPVCGNDEGVWEGGKRRRGPVKVICREFMKFVTVDHVLRDNSLRAQSMYLML